MALHDRNDGEPRSGAAALLRGFDVVTDAATGLMFVGGAIAMFAMVITRYGFAWSDASIEIIVRYCMIWGTFLGVSAGVRLGINIRFTLLEHVFGDSGRKIVQTIALCLTFLIAAGLALSGEALVEETVMFGEVIPTSLRWPVWPFHAAILAGGVLLCLQAVRSLVELWRPGAPAASDLTDVGGV